MECNEKFLRQMLASPYRNAVGQALLERIDAGMAVRIIQADGQQVALERREAALQLLVNALGDASPIIGMVAYGWPKSPRVCDVALSSLHKVEPEVFSFTPKADAAKRDEERAEGLKKWEEKRVPKATRKEVEK